jgi:arylsulfatase A-like enzyme
MAPAVRYAAAMQRRLLLPIIPTLLAASSFTLAVDTAQRRPNVILIYTDDHDRDEIGCFGGKVLTPHMDGLARDGVKFTRFYVASAVCSPSRYNALSGRYASRSLSTQTRMPTTGPVNLGWESGVYGEKTCMALALKAGGYATGMVGKWHQGSAGPLKRFRPDDDANDPKVRQALRENFDKVVESIKSCGFDYAAAAYRDNTDPKGEKVWIPKALQFHNMEWVTDGALRFIEQNKERPFFLYMAPTLVHSPSPLKSLQADPRITPLGFLDKAPDVQPSRKSVLDRVEKAGVEKRFVGSTWLDDGVGAVLKKLDELKLAENTLVLLAGDNGNKAKFTCYDGGAREPFVARWPGVIKPGSVCDKLVSNLDFVPTILEVCGVSAPASVVRDGHSIAAALKSDASYRRESLMLEITTERAVVSDDGFKYIAARYTPEILEQVKAGKKFNHWCQPMERATHTYDADRQYPGYFDLDQLYDLNADPNEQKNLAGNPAHKERLERLKQLLRAESQRLPHMFGEFKPVGEAPSR